MVNTEHNELSWILANKEQLKLSDLECAIFSLDALTIRRINNSTWYEFPQFKTGNRYFRDYLLGSIVWYSKCSISNFEFEVFGKSPTEVIRNLIEVFEGCFSLWADENAVREFIKMYIKKQSSNVHNFARYLSEQ